MNFKEENEKFKEAIIYACEMISCGENRKANENLCEALGVPHNHFDDEDE